MIWIIFIKILKNCNLNKKRKILLDFDGLIADTFTNKKFNPLLAELFIRGTKINMSLAFITQSYFALPKNIRLNSTHYFIIKTANKQRHQQIALNNLLDFNVKDFMIL